MAKVHFKVHLLAISVIASLLFSWFISKSYYENKTNSTHQTMQNTIAELEEQLQLTVSERDEVLENYNQFVTTDAEPLFKVEQGELTEEEHAFLVAINETNFDIEIPDSVTRKYIFENGSYRLFDTKFNYELGDSYLYFDTYPYYHVLLKHTDHTLVLEYDISAGKALTSFGMITYNTINKEIINNSYSFGTGAGTSEVFVNGVEYYTNFQEFE